MKMWFGKDASRWFAHLRSADVSATTDREFASWLNRDPHNEEEFERRELIWELLGEVQDDPEMLRIARRRSARDSRWQWRPHSRTRWVLTAAALATLAVTGYWQFNTLSRSRAIRIQEMVLATRTGEQKQITLPDGSRVLLNTATRLRERFTDRIRRLDLEQGEAVFLVRHDAHWPFVVFAGSTSTRDVGTAFDVSHLVGRTEISVIKGRVQVDASSAAAAHQRIELSAGQATDFTKAEGLGPVAAADLSRIAAWQRHRVEFHNDTLASAVRDFNRYITMPIVIGDPSLAGIRISGVFRSDDAPAFIRALYGTLGIQSQVRGNTVVLLRHKDPRG